MFSSYSVKRRVKMRFWYYITCYKYSMRNFQKRFRQTAIKTRKNYIFVSCVSIFRKYTWLFAYCKGGASWMRNRHFSVAPYITICPSTETYFALYLRGAMSAVTGIYPFRLLLNIILFALRYFFTLTNSAYPDEMPHDGISPVCKCKQHVPKNIFHNWNAAEYLL